MASWSQLYPYAAGFQDLQALLQSTGGVDKQMCFCCFEARDLFSENRDILKYSDTPRLWAHRGCQKMIIMTKHERGAKECKEGAEGQAHGESQS